jgi:hypothetical protein
LANPSTPPKLAGLLLHNQIGVEHGSVTLYRLKLDDLSKEKLESLVEEFDEDDFPPSD